MKRERNAFLCDFAQNFKPEEVESGVAESLWHRMMWQLFVKKGVVEAMLGSLANLPMWTAEKLFKRVGGLRRRCSRFFILGRKKALKIKTCF